jgi:hypothetical protein
LQPTSGIFSPHGLLNTSCAARSRQPQVEISSSMLFVTASAGSRAAKVTPHYEAGTSLGITVLLTNATPSHPSDQESTALTKPDDAFSGPAVIAPLHHRLHTYHRQIMAHRP